MGIEFKVTNNTKKFMNALKLGETKVLQNVGEFIIRKMETYTPVDTGYLRSRNKYEVTGTVFNRNLKLTNDCDYAGYVHYGTYKMKARPFMEWAIYRHIPEIEIIAGKYFKDLRL